MLEAAAAFQLSGRIGAAIRALQQVKTVAGQQGRTDVALSATTRIAGIREAFGNERVDLARSNTGSVALTDREREVAQMAVAGRSNQEIAARLVLSVRTVETHMHRIMRKLDVSRRQDIRSHLLNR
nr:helix-turn-helix transcriptional regulator [Lysinibacter cavernae]